MVKAMQASSRDDDMYGEDETSIGFQHRIAVLPGKEAGRLRNS